MTESKNLEWVQQTPQPLPCGQPPPALHLPGPFSPRLEAQAGWRERGYHGVLRGLLWEGRRQLGGWGRGLHGGWGTRPFPASRGASSSHPGCVHHPHAHAGEGHKDKCLPMRDRRQAPSPKKRTHSSTSVVGQQRSLSTSGPREARHRGAALRQAAPDRPRSVAPAQPAAAVHPRPQPADLWGQKAASLGGTHSSPVMDAGAGQGRGQHGTGQQETSTPHPSLLSLAVWSTRPSQDSCASPRTLAQLHLLQAIPACLHCRAGVDMPMVALGSDSISVMRIQSAKWASSRTRHIPPGQSSLSQLT